MQGRLIVDLGAIKANWLTLKACQPESDMAAVVKADAYGLGVEAVSRALAEVGCQTFFVALPDEGLTLRAALPKARIFILHGYDDKRHEDYCDARLSPVLCSPEQLSRWQALDKPADLLAALQVDTGMNRLGLTPEEAFNLPKAPEGVDLIISHLVESELVNSSITQAQKQLVETLSHHFHGLPFSLANSGGCFLGRSFGFDMCRAGVALYGEQSFSGSESIKPVATLLAPVLMTREIKVGETLGYGATYKAKTPMKTATLGLGYADGLHRIASRADDQPVTLFGWYEGYQLPVAGRLSMDSLTLDISHLPEGTIKAGDLIEMLGNNVPLATLAKACQTISYEVLTGLKMCRFPRIYKGRHGQS